MKILKILLLAMLINIIISENIWSQTMVEDLGDIQIFTLEDANQVLKSYFVFTNKSVETLKVASIKKSCACASIKIESDRDIVNPGQSINFLMRIDLSKKSITQDYVLNEKSIVTLKKTSGDYTLLLQTIANVKMFGLPRRIDLGKLKDESFTVRRYLNIRPPVKSKFKIISINCVHPFVNVSYEKKLLTRDYRIYFEFEMENMKLGRNSFKLNMKYILDGKERNQTGLVQFEKIPKIQYPKSISMGVVNVKEKLMSRQFELLPGYEGIKFSIRGVKTEPKKYLLCDCSEIEEKNAALCIVRFAIPSNAIAGTVSRGNIRIEFFKDIAPIDIPVFALFLRGTD